MLRREGLSPFSHGAHLLHRERRSLHGSWGVLRERGVYGRALRGELSAARGAQWQGVLPVSVKVRPATGTKRHA